MGLRNIRECNPKQGKSAAGASRTCFVPSGSTQNGLIFWTFVIFRMAVITETSHGGHSKICPKSFGGPWATVARRGSLWVAPGIEKAKKGPIIRLSLIGNARASLP